jgi:hypothetical protein
MSDIEKDIEVASGEDLGVDGIAEAFESVQEGGDATVDELDLASLHKGVQDYQNGVNRTGRSKNSGMANYRRTLKLYLNFLKDNGISEVEVGAVVNEFAVKVLGSKAAYRKSYNYLLTCVKGGHLPPEWELGTVNGQNGFRLKAEAEPEAEVKA